MGRGGMMFIQQRNNTLFRVESVNGSADDRVDNILRGREDANTARQIIQDGELIHRATQAVNFFLQLCD
jgi:hypothetical protein